MEEAATPFPSEETTPPVTNIYFGAIHVAQTQPQGVSTLHRSDVHVIMFGRPQTVKSNSRHAANNNSSASNPQKYSETFFFSRCL